MGSVCSKQLRVPNGITAGALFKQFVGGPWNRSLIHRAGSVKHYALHRNALREPSIPSWRSETGMASFLRKCERYCKPESLWQVGACIADLGIQGLGVVTVMVCMQVQVVLKRVCLTNSIGTKLA